MKGGLVLVAGNCGYMAGFMAQKGTLFVCGDAGDAFADSMYATVRYVRGNIAGLGTDAVLVSMEADEIKLLDETLSTYLPSDLRKTKLPAADFKKVSGRKL